MTLPSLWQDRTPRTAPGQPATVEGRCDVAVVGAGLSQRNRGCRTLGGK